jgi:ubiquinone/menaquinone biosynthesis C-methylase UbiE
MNPTLSPAILKGIQNEKIMVLVRRTLEEDFQTFNVSKPSELASLTMSELVAAGVDYPKAAALLALEIYPAWEGKSVRKLYHDYNWAVERTGSAKVASELINGSSLVDIGGGPGTFSLELLKLRESNPLKITVADIDDWRNDQARQNPNISFSKLTIGGKLPFEDAAFDCGSLLYVLHHVETDHSEFLKECARCIRKTLILFEDVRVDVNQGVPKGAHRPARKLESDFLKLSLDEQTQFIAVVDYVCNHIASQALGMPVPGKYYELRELEDKLRRLFPKAKVETHYHGIYDQKCYPNPEAMYVVQFD